LFKRNVFELLELQMFSRSGTKSNEAQALS